MFQFSANISFLFTEYPFLDRIKAASDVGFKAIEFLFPYDWEPLELKKVLDKSKTKLILFNTAPGSYEKGERGLASIAGREEEFKEQIKQSIKYAKFLNTSQIHIMAGIPSKNINFQDSKSVYKNNLLYAAEECGKNDIYALIEPINTKDIPGYFLNFTEDAVSLIEDINHPFLKLQLDLYHTQIMTGNISFCLKKYINFIKHIQIASPPNRNEPDKGEINYNYIFQLLNELNYNGYIGCEYKPFTNTSDSLAWAKNFGISNK